MLLLNIFSTISGMFLAGILFTIVLASLRYNKILLKEFCQHIQSRGVNKLSIGKFLLLILITSIGLWFVTCIVLGIIYENNYYRDEFSFYALGTPYAFILISTILYGIFYKNVSPRYPALFLIVLFIASLLFLTSIACVFRNQGLLEWGKSKDPFLLIWILCGAFILITTLFFITFDNSLLNIRFSNKLNKVCIVIILLLGCGALICAWEIHFNSINQREIMKLDHKLHSTDQNTINEGLEETYALLVNEYGFNRIQEVLEGRLPDWDPKKYLFVHMYNTLYKQSNEDNGLAQGIYGDYYMSYNNGNPSDHISKIAYDWWNKGSLNEDARSQYRLGDCFAGIIKIPELSTNMALADSLWQKAASQGYELANVRLNDSYDIIE